METKLLLLDLDFTLLRSDKSVSERTLTALKNAQAAGTKIGFSTSRGNTNIQNYVDLIHPDFVVSNGGGTIYEKGRLIHLESFSVEETRKIIARAYELLGPNAEITIDTPVTLYWNRLENKSESFDPSAVYNDMKDFREPGLKICIQTLDEKIAAQIAGCVTACDYLHFSDIPWYKFSSANATKENAVDFLSGYYKIPVAKMAAFGDDYSDIGMLKKCGTGVAMANAIPAVKAIARAQTASCDDDGVAVWIEKNL